MAVVDPRTWIEHLSVQDCWHLLEANAVGRVGVIVGRAPEIFPVNYVVDDRSVVFRTDAGSKLHGIGQAPSVCFEVDEIDVGARTGWSVLVKGRAAEITAPNETRRAADLPLALWATGAKTHWVRVAPIEITGRRVHAVAPRR